jgi:hypothetical protein
MDASAMIAALSSENHAVAGTATVDAERAAAAIAIAVNGETRARAEQFAAEARVAAAERALAEEKAARDFAVHEALGRAGPELDRLRKELRDKQIEFEKLNDWATEREDAAAREADLRTQLAAEVAGRAEDIATLERRNGADRESIRKLMMRHLLDFKRDLLASSASALDDTTKRVITQHEQLLDELNFTSAHAEKLLIEIDESGRVRPRLLHPNRSRARSDNPLSLLLSLARSDA